MGVRVISEERWQALIARLETATAALERQSTLADELARLRQMIADLERRIAANQGANEL